MGRFIKVIRVGSDMQFTKEEKKGLTSIVLLSFNRPQNIERNLKSLYETVQDPFEVILFDNGSPDDATKTLLDKVEGQTKNGQTGKVTVVRNPTNLGCSAGRNAALKHTQGEFIVTMDDDMTYRQDWLKNLKARINEDKKIGAAEAKIVFPNGLVDWNGGRIEKIHGHRADFQLVDRYKTENDTTLEGKIDCDWIGGGATIVRRSAAELVDHKLFYENGYEDFDYGLQLRKEGFRLVNCPDAVVVHDHFGHNLKEMARIARENPAYVKARKDKQTIYGSMLRLFQETGFNLIDEFKGSYWYSANNENLEDKTDDEIAALCWQELQKRDLTPLKEEDPQVEEVTVFHAKRRRALMKKYGFNSMDFCLVVPGAVSNMVSTYEQAFRLNTESVELREIGARAYDWMSKKIRLLVDASPDAHFLFNLDTGALNVCGVDQLVRAFDGAWTPVENNPDFAWAPKWIARTMIWNDLKYLTVSLTQKESDRLKRSRQVYEQATGQFRKREFKEAIGLYDALIASCPTYAWAYSDKALALERLGDLEGAKRSAAKALEREPANEYLQKQVEAISAKI